MLMGAASRRELGSHSLLAQRSCLLKTMTAPSSWEQPFILPVLEGAHGWVLELRHDI